jgi:LacI family transcriptional regulator
VAVTLNDVARRAGVSKSTVSNVVRGAIPVAAPTRSRVEAAISELGYRPNEVARALKQRATQTLGLVITETVNPFAASLAQAVVRRARRDGYAVLIADTDGDQEIEAAQCRALVARRVDGVIFAALTEGSTSLADLLDRGVPTVLASFGGRLDRRAGAIDIDEENAMETVVGYLADLGHVRLAFARQHAREAEVDRRPSAFSAAVARHELEDVGLDGDPTAICCMNDGVAIDLMDALERGGRRVPEDVSVVGFDDVPLASHHRIRLTTVRQDAATIGTRAAELLIAAVVAGEPVERREIVRGELIVRDSTGPAPARAARAGSAA